MDFAFPSADLRANWFFRSLLEHKSETCINMPIGFPNDSMCSRIRFNAYGVSYKYSPIAPNGPVYAQLRCCAETGQPQLPRHMARILPDPQLFLVTSLKVKDLWVSINMDSELQDA